MRILYLPNSHCQQRQLEKPNFLAYPVRLAMEAEWYRKQGHEMDWDNNFGQGLGWKKYDKVITQPENLPFLTLPHPDREWTNAKDKAYQHNGNFKYHPGTYIMAASGCWWGKCSFCVENSSRVLPIEEDKDNKSSSNAMLGSPKYETRLVEDVLDEIEECQNLGFKEVFDDSATFPTGVWLDLFLEYIRERNIKIKLSCNMRLIDVDYEMMKQTGFRMLLFGLESANQQTLDQINKGVKIEKAIEVIKKASKAGLEPHIAVMFGFPWETDKEAVNTLNLVHYLLRKGYAKTAQASFFNQKGLLSNGNHRNYIHAIYNAAYYLDFWSNKLRDIHNIDDLKYLWRQIKAGLQNR